MYIQTTPVVFVSSTTQLPNKTVHKHIAPQNNVRSSTARKRKQRANAQYRQREQERQNLFRRKAIEAENPEQRSMRRKQRNENDRARNSVKLSSIPQERRFFKTGDIHKTYMHSCTIRNITIIEYKREELDTRNILLDGTNTVLYKDNEDNLVQGKGSEQSRRTSSLKLRIRQKY